MDRLDRYIDRGSASFGQSLMHTFCVKRVSKCIESLLMFLHTGSVHFL